MAADDNALKDPRFDDHSNLSQGNLNEDSRYQALQKEYEKEYLANSKPVGEMSREEYSDYRYEVDEKARNQFKRLYPDDYEEYTPKATETPQAEEKPVYMSSEPETEKPKTPQGSKITKLKNKEELNSEIEDLLKEREKAIADNANPESIIEIDEQINQRRENLFRLEKANKANEEVIEQVIEEQDKPHIVTHYDTLGISPNASQEEIKVALDNFVSQYNPKNNKQIKTKEWKKIANYKKTVEHDLLSGDENRREYSLYVATANKQLAEIVSNRPENLLNTIDEDIIRKSVRDSSAYGVLGVSSNVGWNEINKKRKDLIREYQSSHGPNSYKVQEVEEAYQEIGGDLYGAEKELAREAYDKKLKALEAAAVSQFIISRDKEIEKQKALEAETEGRQGQYVETQSVSNEEFEQVAAGFTAGTVAAGGQQSTVLAMGTQALKNKVVTGLSQSAAGKAVASGVAKAMAQTAARLGIKMTSSAIAAAAGAAVTLGASLAIGATVAAIKNADKLMKGMLTFVGMVSSLFASGASAAVSGFSSNLAIAIITVPLVVSFMVLIVNNSTYMVPPGRDIIITDGEVGEDVVKVGCFAYSGPWPEDVLRVQKQAAEIILSTGDYGRLLCGSSDVKVVYEGDCGYGGYVKGNDFITICFDGTGSLNNTLYTLAHETGHIFVGRNYGIFNAYENNIYSVYEDEKDKADCSYPFKAEFDSQEAFSESIALYILGNRVWERLSLCLDNQAFPYSMPNTYSFFLEYMF